MSPLREFLVGANLARPKDRRRWRRSHEGGIEITRRGFLVGAGITTAAAIFGGFELATHATNPTRQETPQEDLLHKWVTEFDTNGVVGQRRVITQQEWGLLDVSPVFFGNEKKSKAQEVSVVYLLQIPPTPAADGSFSVPVTKASGKVYGVHLHDYPIETSPQSNQLIFISDGLSVDPRLANLEGGKILNPKELDVTVGALLQVDVNNQVVLQGELSTFFIANKIQL